MTFFDGIYPFYPQSQKPFVFDVDLIVVIIVFLVIAFSFLLILPGIRGRAVSSDPVRFPIGLRQSVRETFLQLFSPAERGGVGNPHMLSSLKLVWIHLVGSLVSVVAGCLIGGSVS